MTKPANVVLGILGSTLDAVGGQGSARWERWRPTIDLCRHPELPIARLELITFPETRRLVELTLADLAKVSRATEVRCHELPFKNPWDFEEVYAKLFEWLRSFEFRTESEQYFVHITTGTHVAQICWFLLTESRHLPGRLLQTSPARDRRALGQYRIIDLDLNHYDAIARRHAKEIHDSVSFLKAGIETRNVAFNHLMASIEVVATRSDAPLLLAGPTGAGKSQLARRIYALKRERHLVAGPLVEVNCATLRGDGAMSTLFGHTKGAFTGAAQDRPGLLRSANGGVLFLDEIGELGLDEQAMLLRALEDKTFFPVGSDKPVKSDFRLLAGTNRDLAQRVARGLFREDLLARINLWTFTLPGLTERPEDIEPNLDYELRRWEEQSGRRVTINRQAREGFLAFARSADALWRGNFRDLNAAITRMATLAPGGRIDEATVSEELTRLRKAWTAGFSDAAHKSAGVASRARSDQQPDKTQVDPLEVLPSNVLTSLDRFERVQLADVITVCRQSRNLSEADRTLFASSRALKAKSNDADRLRKYLLRFGLSFDGLVRG